MTTADFGGIAATSALTQILRSLSYSSNKFHLLVNQSDRDRDVPPYEPDPQNPQAIPKRSEPISVNTGIQAEILVADQEIHDTTGLQLASLGKKSNEKSGKAIMARQREGDIVNFPFYDNLARAKKYEGKIYIDLIPKIYDTKRIIRILNKDNTHALVPVNQQFMINGIQEIYDLTVGKYDVLVTIGPSYNTAREEAAETMLNFVQYVPNVGPIIADLIAKNLDWPGAETM